MLEPQNTQIRFIELASSGVAELARVPACPNSGEFGYPSLLHDDARSVSCSVSSRLVACTEFASCVFRLHHHHQSCTGALCCVALWECIECRPQVEHSRWSWSPYLSHLPRPMSPAAFSMAKT